MPHAAPAPVAVVAVSHPGAALAIRLADALPDCDLYLERKTAPAPVPTGPQIRLYDLPLKPTLQRLFTQYPGLVVFLPVGATVRLLAPVLTDKRRDAAVICVDDAGRYAVSLLSGHQGGADALAHQAAAILGAHPVITAASDALSVTAVDMVGRAAGWQIDASPADLTRAAAAVVNGDPVALWFDPETGAAWPDDAPPSDGITTVSGIAELANPSYRAALLVTDQVSPVPRYAAGFDIPIITYRPPTLIAGIGCRRGVAMPHLLELLQSVFTAQSLSLKSLSAIATADIKADEPGLNALAEHLNVPLLAYTASQLNAAAAERQTVAADTTPGLAPPTPSAARDLLGVFGVSEPAALLAAGAPGLLHPRIKSDRATVALARLSPGPRSQQ